MSARTLSTLIKRPKANGQRNGTRSRDAIHPPVRANHRFSSQHSSRTPDSGSPLRRQRLLEFHLHPGDAQRQNAIRTTCCQRPPTGFMLEVP